MFHCFDSCCVSDGKWQAQISFIVTNLFKKSPGSPSNQCKLPPETQNQTHFGASVKILRTHLADVSIISHNQFFGQNVKNPWVETSIVIAVAVCLIVIVGHRSVCI